MKRKSDVLERVDPRAKKAKLGDASKKPLRLKYRQRGANDLIEHSQDSSVFDRELTRAICIGLYGVGFDAAKSSALEGFQAAVEEYMYRFAQKIKTSMQHSRRQEPLPQDFIHALSQFNLSSSALIDEREIIIPPRITQAPILPPSTTQPAETSLFASPNFLDPTSESVAASYRKRYIPKHFPDFPAQHAYQETAVFTDRETDTMKIREHVTEEGTQAETALRKLMAANRAANGRNGRLRGRRKPLEVEKKGQELWKAAMDAALEEDKRRARESAAADSGVFGMDGVVEETSIQKTEEVEPLMSVANYDRAYWRRATHGFGLSI